MFYERLWISASRGQVAQLPQSRAHAGGARFVCVISCGQRENALKITGGRAA